MRPCLTDSAMSKSQLGINTKLRSIENQIPFTIPLKTDENELHKHLKFCRISTERTKLEYTELSVLLSVVEVLVVLIKK